MKDETRTAIYHDLLELINTTTNTKRLWSNWGNDVVAKSADRLRRDGVSETQIKEDLRYIHSVIIDIGYEFAKVPLPERNWSECSKAASKVLRQSQLYKE